MLLVWLWVCDSRVARLNYYGITFNYSYPKHLNSMQIIRHYAKSPEIIAFALLFRYNREPSVPPLESTQKQTQFSPGITCKKKSIQTTTSSMFAQRIPARERSGSELITVPMSSAGRPRSPSRRSLHSRTQHTRRKK